MIRIIRIYSHLSRDCLATIDITRIEASLVQPGVVGPHRKQGFSVTLGRGRLPGARCLEKKNQGENVGALKIVARSRVDS